MEKITQPWKQAAVIKLLGRSVGYKMLCNRIENPWEPTSKYVVIDLENDYFIVRFALEENCNHTLVDEPWIILESYLTVQKWSPEFTLTTVKPSHVIPWVHFPGMPI